MLTARSNPILPVHKKGLPIKEAFFVYFFSRGQSPAVKVLTVAGEPIMW